MFFDVLMCFFVHLIHVLLQINNYLHAVIISFCCIPLIKLSRIFYKNLCRCVLSVFQVTPNSFANDNFDLPFNNCFFI